MFAAPSYARGSPWIGAVAQMFTRRSGISVRQRLQQDAVDDAEHGGGGADAEGDGQDHRGSESRRARHQPQAVANVLPGVPDPRDPACVARRLDDLHAAEFPAGRLARLARRHPGCDVFLDELIEVQLDFFVQFAIGGAGPHERAQPAVEDVDNAHDRILSSCSR